MRAQTCCLLYFHMQLLQLTGPRRLIPIKSRCEDNENMKSIYEKGFYDWSEEYSFKEIKFVSRYIEKREIKCCWKKTDFLLAQIKAFWI